MSETHTAVEFRNVRKKYYIQQRATPRLGAWVVDKLFEHLRREPFWPLDDVSFSVPKGQMMGLLGANGAGKSTTLKLAAGITQPTEGTVRTRGRLCSMLELGVGFHPDLSGMENIFYNGIILGLTREEVLERLEKIVTFSGLDPAFLAEPVKHYSSGMYARLACSVSMHLDPEILLIDEVFSVGDAGFQQKGINRILELRDSGVTIMMVSHVISAMRDLCSRIVWINDGKVRADGDPGEISSEYRHHMIDQILDDSNFMKPETLTVQELDATSAAASLQSIRVSNGDGVEIEQPVMEDCVVIEIGFEQEGDGVVESLEIAARWPDGRTLFRDMTPLDDGAVKSGKVRYIIERWPFYQTPVHLNVAIHGKAGVLLDRKLNWKIIGTKPGNDKNSERVVMSPATRWSVIE